MQKNILNSNHETHKEIETQPKNKKQRLENHILSESFKMGDLDIDKIKQQSKKLGI